MNQQEFLTCVAQNLHAAGIPFMLAGSHASSYHGQPRATRDLDLVIDPTKEQLETFLGFFGEHYYVSAAAALEALRTRSIFNIINLSEGWKADLIVRKDRPFSLEEFARRKTVTFGQISIPIASAEDVILTKLEWDKLTPSEQQVRDATNVAVVQRSNLDEAYLRKWAASLGIAAKLEQLLREADAL